MDKKDRARNMSKPYSCIVTLARIAGMITGHDDVFIREIVQQALDMSRKKLPIVRPRGR